MVRCNILRAMTLEGPVLWADGDFTKVLPNGTEEPATFADYMRDAGLPVLANRKIEE